VNRQVRAELRADRSPARGHVSDRSSDARSRSWGRRSLRLTAARLVSHEVVDSVHFEVAPMQVLHPFRFGQSLLARQDQRLKRAVPQGVLG